MTDRLNQLLNFYEKDSNDTFILFALAKEYSKLEEYEVSLSYYEKLLEKDPDYIGAYYHKGILMSELEMDDEALILLRKGLELSEQNGSSKDISEFQQAILNIEYS